MKLSAKGILLPAVILFVICAVMTAALAGTNLLTADLIEQAALRMAEESRKTVLGAAESFDERDSYYIGIAGGNTVGYVFETESKGYGGTIKVMTGIDTDGNVTGVVILSHAETPGLGANAAKEKFRDNFKQEAPAQGFTVVKNRKAGKGEIEAMTGATITTKAVSDAVNKAIEQYESVKGGA